MAALRRDTVWRRGNYVITSRTHIRTTVSGDLESSANPSVRRADDRWRGDYRQPAGKEPRWLRSGPIQ